METIDNSIESKIAKWIVILTGVAIIGFIGWVGTDVYQFKSHGQTITIMNFMDTAGLSHNDKTKKIKIILNDTVLLFTRVLAGK